MSSEIQPARRTQQCNAGFTEKRPFLRFAEKRKTGRKSFFFQNNFQNLLKDWYSLGKRVFFLLTTLPGRGQNMVAIKKWFFFGPQKSGFRPENPFFSVFCQRGVRNPWHWFCFETFGSIVRLFVSEFRPFSWGEPGRRAEKSSPTPLWGHRLPVTALALSARRPCGPRTGWIIIIIMINIIDIICICRPLRGCPDFGK